MTVRFALCFLLALGGAAAAAQPSEEDRAAALLQAGHRQEALHAFQAIIAAKPSDPSEALFQAATISYEDGNWRTAKPLAQQLVKLRPGSFVSWELMIQVYQAAGEQEDRDLAIQSLYDAWHSAPDAETRARITFRRDRIAGPKHTVIAQEALDPGGDDIVRYVFDPVDNAGPAAHLIVLRSDNDTNARWRDNGTVAPDTNVYHLDTIEQLADGKTSDRSYAFYTEQPDYDLIRNKVVQILHGEIKPLNGDADPFWTGGER